MAATWRPRSRDCPTNSRPRASDHANALAAMRATLAAQRDGEADPLYYLRDELQAAQNAAAAARKGQPWLATAGFAGKPARSAAAVCSP